MDVRIGPHSTVRKRKLCDIVEMNKFEDDPKSQRMECEESKKQNHSEIEKRRRDKMNTYITELASMVPMCSAMSRKLDKLSVLRLAVQYMKTLRGSMNSYTEGVYKPSLLPDEELKHLILQISDGFLFVVSCDRGRILFVSESVLRILNYSQNDLLGQNWFDILHPKDIAKVKEQLSSSDVSPRERLIDVKTMLPAKTDLSQTSPGARRSFFCRMKFKVSPSKEEADTTTGIPKRRKSHSLDRKYCVIHCTGYLKSWTSSNLSMESELESCYNLSCLVAVGHIQKNINNVVSANDIELRPVEFISRHSMDGKFYFIDQRVTLVLGYLSQELQGTSCYEYIHQDDITHIAEFHKRVLQDKEKVTSQIYRFRKKEGNFAYLISKWKKFCNPWTNEFEYIISLNTLVPMTDVGLVESSNSATEDFVNSNSNSLDTVLSYLPCSGNVGDTQRFIGTKVGAGKIGRQIAEELLEMQKGTDVSVGTTVTAETLNPSSYLPQDSEHVCVPCAHTSSPNNELLGYSTSSNNSISSQYAASTHSNASSRLMESAVVPQSANPLINEEVIQASHQNSSSEGNDEAAMAVIMSLLEADAGLGGPVDFTGLPWPLL